MRGISSAGKGGIDYVGTYWLASQGNRSLDLNGTPGVGGVAQTFDTVPDQTYHVQFDMAGHFSGLLQEMRVSAADQVAHWGVYNPDMQESLKHRLITLF